MNIITGYTGKKHVTAGNDGCLNMGFAGTDDYVLNVGKKLEAQIVSNNQVRIFDGEILMQGRQASIDAGTYEDVNIENGEQLLGRNDLIVARYTLDSETAVEKIELAVVKVRQQKQPKILRLQREILETRLRSMRCLCIG